MQIIEHPHEFHIRFEFGKWYKRNYEAVKALPGKRWDPEKKIWRVPSRARQEVYTLRESHKATIMLAQYAAPQQTGDLPPMPELEIDIPLKPGVQLRHYQAQGIAQNLEFGSSLNGDEPGLGKTIQSISTVVALGAYPCLVICPSSLKLNWQNEWHKFTDRKAMILADKTKDTWHQYYKVGIVDIFITNYESLQKFFVAHMPAKDNNKKKNGLHSRNIVMRDVIDLFQSVIVDESHRCKNDETITSKLTLRVCHKKKHVFALSGTPVMNRPADLWPQLAIINKLHHFGGKEAFIERYCEGGKGANNLKELNYRLRKHCMFRREKKDVLKDLPEKQRQMIVCDITSRDEYSQAARDFTNYLKAQGCDSKEVAKKLKGEILFKINVLRQISARGKLHQVKDFTEDIVSAGEKLVLFCNLHEIVDALKKMFPAAVMITGRQTDQEKQAAVDKFQRDPSCSLAILNIRAGGVGHTLTASSRVAFVEYPWNPAMCVQCEDRVHRIGQQNNVMATYFLGKDTIDERLMEIIMEKMKIANAVMGSDDDLDMEVVNKIIDLFNI